MSLQQPSSGLRQENTQAASVSPMLHVLYRILLGMRDGKDNDAAKQHQQQSSVIHHLLFSQLVPLHKPDAMVLWRDQMSVLELYHEPLVKCVAVALKQQPQHIPALVLALLQPDIFPVAGNTPKQVLLLHEIDMYVGFIEVDQQEPDTAAHWFTTFLTVLSRSVSSDHSRVAERALEFFKNKNFVRLIQNNAESSLELLLPALIRGEPSWNPTVRKMTYHVLKELQIQCVEAFQVVSDRLFSGRQSSITSNNNVSSSQQSARNLLHSASTQPVVTGLSLKAGMGQWKPPKGTVASIQPPSGRTFRGVGALGRGAAPWAAAGDQPPSTITGVAPWAMTGTKEPPVTITGVAPWALSSTASQGPPVHKKRTHELGGVSEATKSGAPAKEQSGFEFVQACLENLKPPDEEFGASSWSKAQMAETPTLLEDLKFHDLVFGHDLGAGAFGSVRYARHIDKTKSRSRWPEYAVKIISTEKIRQLGYETSVQREIAVLRLLQHPGIARLVSSFRFNDGAYLVLEYASGGDLHSLLRKNGSLDHKSTRFVVGELVAVLSSIHDLGFVYGDLKTENVLITETGHIKLTDFGGCRPVTAEARKQVRAIANGLLSKLRDGDWKREHGGQAQSGSSVVEVEDESQMLVEDDDAEDDQRIEGTISFLPPEVVMGSVPTKAADSWALGCLTYQCLSGRPPFLELDEESTRNNIVSFDSHGDSSNQVARLFEDKHASDIEPNARQLIKSLLCRSASSRPDMERISLLDFFSGIDVFSLYRQEAYPLGVGNSAPAPDAQWARRQFSSIWAPQPVAYDISLPDETSNSRLSSQSDTLSAPISEGDEYGGYFSASGNAPNALGRISERLPTRPL
jgi:serine/threonine protein kinase